MPALRKPHRVGFLVPALTVEGADAANAGEAALLLWIACIEICQRHPGLAVHDAEANALVSLDGHFTPLHARPGAAPSDAFWGPARRDELVWLELALPRPGAVRLHTLARDGQRETFELLAGSTGDQIHQVLERWLAARGLAVLPRRFEPATASEILAAVRVIAPALSEQARAAVQLEEQAWAAMADAGAADRSTAMGGPGGDEADSEQITGGPGAALQALGMSHRLARAVAARLTPALKAPALRLLALALHEDLGELILAADPAQPQALLDKFRGDASRGRDYALLRRIIASAPGWARPYAELIGGASLDPAVRPSELETVAGAGLAALCRPEQRDVIETAADRLEDNGRVDEGIRLLERAVTLHASSSEAHIALVNLHRRTDRRGAWLAEAYRGALRHGCPLTASLPWYPDQIQVDLLVSDALVQVGRLTEAIALRADRLDGREASWPRHTRILTNWRSDPRFAARCYAREGALRGDPARAIEGYRRVAPDDAVDVAMLLDALVATGREDEVALAWAEHGLGAQVTEPVARLAAARGLLAAGDWRRGIEELWRVELTQPARDEHVAIASCGILLAAAPLSVLEAALEERVALGATALARRMARDIADFVPGAHASAIVVAALGKTTATEFDPAWLAGFPADTASRRAIDALFGELASLPRPSSAADAALPRPGSAADASLRIRADRLVERWLAVVFTDAAEDDPAALAQAASYAAAQALARYLAATTAPPSPLAGALRTVAAEALALVRRHRGALDDRHARGVLGALEPVLRRVDRWLGNTWLACVERSCAIDERAAGDVVGFARDLATVAARILGPEETAVLSASIARLARERPDGWAAAVIAQSVRLAAHTGCTGAVELADAVAAQLAANQIEPDDALDLLYTACYLTEGVSAGPCVHAARLLLATGRGPAALAVLCAGLGAADLAWRTVQLASLADAWTQAKLDVPLAFDRLTAQLDEALSRGDLARAEQLGQLAVAIDPRNTPAHRNLGLALARQGKPIEAMHHLARASPDQARQLLVSAAPASPSEPRRELLVSAAPASVSDPARQLLSSASPASPPDPGRDPVFQLLDTGDCAAAAAQLADPSWRVRRAALTAIRHRTAAENALDVTPRARAAAIAVLADTAGAIEREPLIARTIALAIREQDYFARDPVPRLGEQMTRDAFDREFAARGGVVPAAAAPPLPPRFVDRVVVPGGRIERISDYVALLRDLAALTPREALAQFDLDDAAYLEVATAWGAAIAADPAIAAAIAAGLAKR